jgi:hypothetical protein
VAELAQGLDDKKTTWQRLFKASTLCPEGPCRESILVPRPLHNGGNNYCIPRADNRSPSTIFSVVTLIPKQIPSSLHSHLPLAKRRRSRNIHHTALLHDIPSYAWRPLYNRRPREPRSGYANGFTRQEPATIQCGPIEALLSDMELNKICMDPSVQDFLEI